VTDLAKRPRGGWQIGTHRRDGRASPSPWTAEHPDPAPDCYTVYRAANGVFVVHHYLTPTAREPCCVVELIPRDGESDVDTLRRAYPPGALCSRLQKEGM
jgi:hypothetical protein